MRHRRIIYLVGCLHKRGGNDECISNKSNLIEPVSFTQLFLPIIFLRSTSFFAEFYAPFFYMAGKREACLGNPASLS